MPRETKSPEIIAEVLFVYFNNTTLSIGEIAYKCNCYVSEVDSIIQEYLRGNERFETLESRLNFYDLSFL